jgi:CBS domain-containing protein
VGNPALSTNSSLLRVCLALLHCDGEFAGIQVRADVSAPISSPVAFTLVDEQHDVARQHGAALGRAWGVAGSMHLGQLVPLDQKIVTVPSACPVNVAFETMRENSFDQVPVEAPDGSIIGVFSYRSFATYLSTYKFSGDSLGRQVIDLSDDPQFFRQSENISAVVDTLHANGVVIIGNEHDVDALVTLYDLLIFMWDITHPFILIGDIETTLRDMMSAACPTERIEEVIGRTFPLEGSRIPTSLEQLSFGELLNVLRNGRNFGEYYRYVFNDKNLISQTLEPVLDIRNSMFHFREQLLDNDLEKLKAAHRWLNRKWKATRAAVQG